MINLLFHPRMVSAQLLSRYCVCVATFLFGLIAVTFEKALESYASFKWFVGPSDAYGIAAIMVALIHLHLIEVWRYRESRASRLLTLVLLWLQTTLWVSILYGQLSTARPLFPGGTPCVFVIAMLSIFNLAARPRPPTCSSP